MLRVHFSSMRPQEASIELKLGQSGWEMNTSRSAEPEQGDKGVIEVGLMVEQAVAEVILLVAADIVRRKANPSLVMLDGTRTMVAIADGPVEQRHSFNCPEPETAEFAFLALLFRTCRAAVRTEAMTDCLELLGRSLLDEPAIRQLDGPPRRLRAVGHLTEADAEALAVAVAWLAEEAEPVLDLRNFIGTGTVLNPHFRAALAIPGVQIWANAAGAKYLTGLGWVPRP